jgi:hypothetical protein
LTGQESLWGNRCDNTLGTFQVTSPEQVTCFLDTITTILIHWLHAQLDTLRQPEGIMLLDDIVGRVSKRPFAPSERPLFPCQ